MLKQTLKTSQFGRIVWVITFPAIALIFLSISFLMNETLVLSNESAIKNHKPSLSLQNTASPTVTVTPVATTTQIDLTSTYSFTLTALGYKETSLISPYDQTQYSFRMPENWLIQGDGILSLDFSYNYNQIEGEDIPTLFGDLVVIFDGQKLDTFLIDKPELDYQQWQILIPASLLADSDSTRHTIEMILNAGWLCEKPHRAALVIHPTSSISFNYNEHPITPDLSRYPRPFYQRAFEPDSVYFVLPAQPTNNDLTSAAAIAAKLGDLTSNRMVISATTDLEFSNLSPSVSSSFEEHLIVVGQPQSNELLPLLNTIVDLPVSLHQRQLGFVTQGPAVVALGDIFDYVFTVTNTLDRDVNLSLLSPLPAYTELVDCIPDCDIDTDDDTITWDNNLLAPDEILSFSLALKATDILTGEILENTVTLVEADLGPVNADTLTATIAANTLNNEPKVSDLGEGDYFFVYNGQAVAKEDGIIQEIISPWDESRAILIITGLSDEAVRKASLAMSSELRFPGMDGPVALVQDAVLPSEVNRASNVVVENTFETLGYSDQIIRGPSEKKINYYFYIPYEWQLNDDAFVNLNFSHSGLLNYEDSELTVLVNDKPSASIALDDETSIAGHIRINLADVGIKAGETNRFTVQPGLSPLIECDPDKAWLLARNNSELYLAHDEAPAPGFDLDLYPYPFHTNRTLSNLLLVIPDIPTTYEVEQVLRLAASLGNSGAGKTILPILAQGSDLPVEKLADYNIIAIGRPSRNALLQRVNAQLPQPFLPNSDEIEQRLDDVILRLPLDISLGYIQLLSSLWNEEQGFLAVTGTTDEAVGNAVDILTTKPWLLDGNLIIVSGDAVRTIDTRKLTSGGLAREVATALPELARTSMITSTTTPESSTPTPMSTPAAMKQPSEDAIQPTWLIPLALSTGVIVIAIFVFAFWQSRRHAAKL